VLQTKVLTLAGAPPFTLHNSNYSFLRHKLLKVFLFSLGPTLNFVGTLQALCFRHPLVHAVLSMLVFSLCTLLYAASVPTRSTYSLCFGVRGAQLVRERALFASDGLAPSEPPRLTWVVVLCLHVCLQYPLPPVAVRAIILLENAVVLYC
jgi:hypothetical protein